jgi:AraC-like DNA-binding protein
MRGEFPRESRSDGGVVRPRRSATVLAWMLPHLLNHVERRGYDATPIRYLPGLRRHDLHDPDMRVPDSAAVEAWHLAELITGDEALGLHMAQAVSVGALDLLEYACRSSPTLDVALRQLARYGRAVGDRTAPRLQAAGDNVAVSWSELAQRARVEFATAFLVRMAREALGGSLAPTEVQFAHGAPDDLGEYRAFFQAPLRFERPANQLVFSGADLTRPFRSADAALSGVVSRHLEKMLTRVPASDDSTAARVRRVLLESLARGGASAEEVARGLGMSERTLHRRLHAEQTSFRHVLDALRGELSSDLLREPQIGIAEIAFLLGYSEPAAFYRSFRRWTGQTPLAFRRGSQTA